MPTLTIPGWRPATLNELLSGHWRKAARLKKQDAEIIAAACWMARLPKAAGKRRVSLRLTLPPRQRRWDKDALWKSLLDGLVKAGALVNDSPNWCEPGEVVYQRGDRLVTEIILEDCQ